MVTLTLTLCQIEAKGQGLVEGERFRYDLMSADFALVEKLRYLVQNYPKSTRRFMRSIINKIQDDVTREKKQQELDELFVDLYAMDDGICRGCRLLLLIAKGVMLYEANQDNGSEEKAIQDMVNNIIDYCEIWLLANDDDQMNVGTEMCQTVAVQGPYALKIVFDSQEVTLNKTQPNIEDICRYLNLCYDAPANVLMEPHGVTSFRHADVRKDTKATLEERKATALRIAQLTDIHIEPHYAEGSSADCGLYVCCLAEQGPGPSGYWGSYQCNIPERTMQLFLDEVKNQNPDLILFSGDVPPHTMWSETRQSQLNCSHILVNALNSTLFGHFVYPSIGNHEMYPTNLFSYKSLDDTRAMLTEFSTMWTPLANLGLEQQATMAANGYYTIKDPNSGLRILAISTNYMYNFNFFNILNHKMPGMQTADNDHEATKVKAEIEHILSQAEADGEKVLIINHHPPGGDYIIPESYWYESLMVRYRDTVVLQVAGHTHTDEFRLLKDENNTVHSMVYVSPSFSTGGMKNPSMRLYYLDNTTYEVIDYEQYYFNLSMYPSQAPEPIPSIVQLYNASSEYGITDFSPAGWEELLARFYTDQDLLLSHRWMSSAGAGPRPESCDEDCRRRHVCRQLHANFDQFEVCATGTPTLTTAGQPLPSSTWPPLEKPGGGGVNAAPNPRGTDKLWGYILIFFVALLLVFFLPTLKVMLLIP